ncbi:MAG: DUF6261 family protein [Candidatus Symbiothrix sp.]|jgi:hypothetical protein|nr:DUF6261 family protein [Candidatus Symbiothrix sp.]
MKFLNLRLSRLLSEEHFQFMKLFYQLLDRFPAIKNLVVALYVPLLDLLAQESRLVDAERGSALSHLIAEADARIDRTIVGINSVINAGLHHFDPAIVAAADRIHARMKAFGNIESKSYEGEATAVGILIDDLRGKFTGDVTLLGLAGWIDELEAAHKAFDELFEQRNVEWAGKPDANLRDVRKQVDDTYRQMIERIAAAATLDDAETYTEFIRQLNREISYFNEHSPRHTRKDIANFAVGDIPTQTYTGEQVIVIPDVFYTGEGQQTVKLVFAKDFTVTYRNNVKVGTAELILHGKGGYRGSKIVTFNINQ